MKVNARVHVRSQDGRQTAVLVPGDTVPSWASVTNPDVLVADAEILPAPAPEQPATDETPPTPAPAKRRTAAKKSE